MTQAADPGLCVGLDIGGTAIRLVRWQGGRCLAARSVPTEVLATVPAAERLERLAGMITGFAGGEERLAAVGLGASGPVDVARGVIDNPYTLPSLAGLPVVTELERLLGCPVLIESDAVVAAVGEHRVGAGAGASRMAMVTLGTGIGVCLLIDGAPFRGPRGAHPEGGHIPVVSGDTPCYCGLAGCWEQVASRAALQALLQPLLPAETPARHLLEAAAAAVPTDGALRDAFLAYGRLVGRGLAVLQGLYMPEVVVIGGSAAAYLNRFQDGIEEVLSRPVELMGAMTVKGAVLKEPGAIGAALLAQEHLVRSGPRAAR